MNRRLVEPKSCALCGKQFLAVPEGATKTLAGEITDGFWWDCCGSQMFAPMAKTVEEYHCDCPDCAESVPCGGDCDPGETECAGCREAREGCEENEFDADVAHGRY